MVCSLVTIRIFAFLVIMERVNYKKNEKNIRFCNGIYYNKLKIINDAYFEKIKKKFLTKKMSFGFLFEPSNEGV